MNGSAESMVLPSTPAKSEPLTARTCEALEAMAETPPLTVCQLPSPLKKFDALGVPLPIRATASVPLEMLLALVVSVVAEAAKPEVISLAA
jgi:hypothetical protein